MTYNYSIKYKSIKTKLTHPFGINSKPKTLILHCRRCGNKDISYTKHKLVGVNKNEH